MSGILKLQIQCAKLTHDTEVVGKMDPFIQFHIGSQNFKTKTATDAGKNPIWNEHFEVQIVDEDLIKFDVFDKDTGSSNDFIGQGSFALKGYLKPGKVSQWIDLSFQGKAAGQVLIEFEFFPNQKNQMGQQYGYQSNEGNLIIKPQQAQLTHDTELFGKMDPYVCIQFGENKFKTGVAKDQGKNPSWKEQFAMRRKNEQIIYFDIWDEDSGSKDDYVAYGYILFDAQIKPGKQEIQIPVWYRGKNAGKILFYFEFTPDNQNFKLNKGFASKFVLNTQCANLTRDTDALSKMDPFVHFNLGNKDFQTKVASGQGKNPTWNEKIQLERNQEDLLVFEIWDKDLISKNDYIAYGLINLNSVFQQKGKQTIWVPVTYKGKDAGKILFEFEI